jgi:phosphate transport system substrate-binding protein
VRRSRLCFAALAAAAVMVPFASPAGAEAKTITMSGSTSVAPLATLWARQYVKGHDVTFRILQGGSDVGIADVAAGRVSIGNSSREPKPGDPGGLVFTKVAGDALCVITNGSNRLPNLDQNGVKAVFGGDVRDWGGVPGSTVGGTIDVFVRTAASGTQDAFDKIFMEGKRVFGGASAKASSGLVQQSVKSNNGGIGYVSLAFTEGVHNVPYKGVSCDLRNAKSGQYGGLRNFYMVTRGAPGGIVKKFLNWVRRSNEAARIAATEWVPLH